MGLIDLSSPFTPIGSILKNSFDWRSIEINLNCKQFSSISGATPIGGADWTTESPKAIQLQTQVYNDISRKTFDSRDASAAYTPRMLHPKCKDKTRRFIEPARAHTRCVHPVGSMPAGVKKNPDGRVGYPIHRNILCKTSAA